MSIEEHGAPPVELDSSRPSPRETDALPSRRSPETRLLRTRLAGEAALFELRPAARTDYHHQRYTTLSHRKGGAAMSESNRSRRRFLLSAGGAAAYLWIPRQVKGYTAKEMRVWAAGETTAASVSKWDLDTPALCLDLDKMEKNFAKAHTTLAENGIQPRPHAKTHKCPAIAKLQIADGAVGISTATVSESEAMIDNGVDKVLQTTANVTLTRFDGPWSSGRAVPDSSSRWTRLTMPRNCRMPPARRASSPMS